MYWIEYRKGEPIPKEFEYDGWKTDRCDYVHGRSTPLMLWICYREGEPIPDELKYDGWKTDKDGDQKSLPILWV